LNILGVLLSPPPPEQVTCHYPKPILLYTGGIDIYAAWTPSVLPLQIFQIGQLFILAVPAEFTTMAGRRLRNAILNIVQPVYSGAVVVISGLSNAYSQYVATPEEYNEQRYEGASTLFGPNTLPAYIQLFSNLAQALVNGNSVPEGQAPYDWTADQINILPPPDPDVGVPGTVVLQPFSNYTRGDNVSTIFISSDPRNNFQTQGSYLYIQNYLGGTWNTVAVDGDWDTKFIWTRVSPGASSYAEIIWNTVNAAPGTYRITHNATALSQSFVLSPFSGVTTSFNLY